LKANSEKYEKTFFETSARRRRIGTAKRTGIPAASAAARAEA
jgi:hypothetical protein